MNRFFLTIIVVFSFFQVNSQEVNGCVISDTANLTVIKVWGTHYERGYAYGYLAGDGMTDIFVNYLQPMFGGAINIARQWIEDGENLFIEEKYKNEAVGMIDGMDAAGINTEEFDYIDVLVCNSFLDFYSFYKNNKIETPGCSALMSWGDATAGTDIDGNSAITRHVDWSQHQSLKRNQVMVVHVPSETDEQPWIMIGFKGQISVLSGVNNSGIACFMHSLGDVSATASTGKAYEPIWFSLRKALEQKDYNQDQKDDVNDIRSVLLDNEWGYAQASIVSCISSSENVEDTLIAMVAELASDKPYTTFRNNLYEDNIPGDNLYAANSSIKRNDSHNYCSRYNSVVANIGDGTEIGSLENLGILRDFSHSSSTNMQMMQFIPDERIFKISVTDDENFAYQKEPLIFNIDSLFAFQTVTNYEKNADAFLIFPNPTKGKVNILYASQNYEVIVDIINVSGQVITRENYNLSNKYLYTQIQLDSGVYSIRIIDGNKILSKKIIVK
ncbi:MAG: T9SS type A sorting domain-containing protein [Bacteroidales bacterium]|nr:T9SS type A sorting domain-containing protein [Bacteroidales bacterium]